AAGRPQQPIDMAAIREHAGAAAAAGIAPDAPAAAEIVDRVLGKQLSVAERRELRERLETFNDVRVERYWHLLAILHDRPPHPAIAAACEWFIQALRAGE
ncbi:MAG TPA: hypothetical protein VJV78_30745, partial [Polyangiales bacterium]|nr:hypothetical protein [Polyangiales bacterium]